MNLYIVNLLMAVVWIAVTGSASLHNLVLGFVLSMLALRLIRERLGGVRHAVRPLRILALAGLFFVELAKSAWKVALMVMKPRMEVQPGIFAYPLTLTRDFEIGLLANLITLTPGTLSVDVSEDRKTLYVHALDCSDVEGARRDIAAGFERRIREAFE